MALRNMAGVRKRSSLNRNRSKSCTPGTTSINYTLKIKTLHARTAGAESAARTCYKNMLRGAAPYMHSCFALNIH